MGFRAVDRVSKEFRLIVEDPSTNFSLCHRE